MIYIYVYACVFVCVCVSECIYEKHSGSLENFLMIVLFLFYMLLEVSFLNNDDFATVFQRRVEPL